ncbi:MAG: DUF2264 domain-containing protein [Treponema sp.]|jgi:hypothetical protein|nr:DUF2264 domain-containing protein [Treponema sp.]
MNREKPLPSPGSNPLISRSDLERSLIGLLAPLKEHAVPGGYYLGNAGAHYSPRTALMEGWSRTLWGIAPLMAGGGACPDLDSVLAVLRQGVDPASPGYWGECGDRDQMLVEMAALALSLIIARRFFWDPLDREEQRRLHAWLSAIEQRELPANNWHFFRILVCAAFRALGLPVNEAAEKESFDLVESCYRGEGWYQDGAGGAYDFYNPMGFHFYGLLYAKLAGAGDSERAARYIERARLFTQKFVSWFREDGSVVPYGRSLTYRFAPVSLFSACAFAGVDVLPWGALKGLILRNMRWWFSRPILDNGGILSVGYGYPNLVMADTYNSPGSPYWGLKAYLALALGEDHPFWQSEEAPLPEIPGGGAEVQTDPVPGFIVTRTPEDVQILNPGQYPGFDMNHPAQKYGKFAYSARFGFCVSLSSYNIEKTGCDSMLMVSSGDGYWRERRQVKGREAGSNWTRSVWNPWPNVEIVTTLVSLGAWHIRVHRIQSGRALETVEGGFALRRYEPAAAGQIPQAALPVCNTAGSEREALAAFPWGASRIAALEPAPEGGRKGSLLFPAPNLNIQDPAVVIPVLEGKLEPGITILASAVRAGDRDAVTGAALPSIALGEYLPHI